VSRAYGRCTNLYKQGKLGDLGRDLEEEEVAKKKLLKEGLPAECYLIVGDPNDISTWKMPYKHADGSPDWDHIPAAVAALSPGGFRGRKVQATPEQKAQAKKKLLAVYRAAKKDPPETLLEAFTFHFFGPITLEEGEELPEWVPIHVLGEWDDPRYGHFTMTREKMQRGIENFRNRLYRPNAPLNRQIVMDTRHSGDGACAWIEDMRIQEPYLLAKPNWTKRGAQIVADRQYSFISPKYLDDPHLGPVFQEITLTNRNFLKELPPIDSPMICLEEGRIEIVPPKTEPYLSEEETPTNLEGGEPPMSDEVKTIKLTVDGEEKEVPLEEVPKLLADRDERVKELEERVQALEKHEEEEPSDPPEPPRPQMVKLETADGVVEMEATEAIQMLMAERQRMLADIHEGRVAEALREFEAKNPPPVLARMLRPILLSLSPDAKPIITLTEGEGKVFGLEQGGKINLWQALTSLMENYPARSDKPVLKLSGSPAPSGDLVSALRALGSTTRELSTEEGQAVAQGILRILGEKPAESED